MTSVRSVILNCGTGMPGKLARPHAHSPARPQRDKTGVNAGTSWLVGRAAELARITAALDGIQEGGQALAVVGEPGTGKSALLAAVAGEARSRGLAVLSARGTAEEEHLPFAALRRLLGPMLGGAGALPPRHRAALHAALGLTDGDPPPRRLFVALAVLELISDAAAAAPVVILVDDLHWVDAASREVVMFAARRVDAERVVMLIADRPEGDGSGLDLAVLPLAALAEDAARELLRRHSPWLSADDEQRVLTEAAGNPLALIELPLAIASARSEEAPPGGAVPLTSRLERAFAARAGELSPQARTALLIAALQDSDAVLETIAAFAELTGEDRGSAGIDEMVAAGLLSTDGASLRFRHPLLRSAVVGRASPGQRDAVHRALAATLAGYPDRATWHRAQAASGPDEGLARALEAGADRALSAGAPGLAQEWLEWAARLSADATQRGRRLLRSAGLAFELGRSGSVGTLVAAARALQLDPVEDSRLAGLERAFDDGVQGDVSDVRRLVGAAQQAHRAREPGLAAQLLLEAAKLCNRGLDDETARARVRAALGDFGLPPDDPRAMVVSALAEPFRHDAAQQAALACWVRRRALDPVAAAQLSLAGYSVGDFESGLAFARRADEGLRRQGRVAMLGQVLVVQMYSALHLGQWDIAKTSSEEAFQTAVETNQQAWARAAQTGTVWLTGILGDYDRAMALSDGLERSGLRITNRALLSAVQFGRGLAALGDNRPVEAFGHLLRLTRPADPAYQVPRCAWAVEYLAEAAALSGNVAGARAVLADIDALTCHTVAPGVLRGLAFARAVLAAEGGAEDAAVHFARARELTGPAAGWFAARLDLAYGRWLREQGRAAAAGDPLLAAQAAFDRLGAVAWAARARRELAAAGYHDTRQQAPSAWALLSAKELQVARLAAAGLSNRQAGERLYLSHRTVGSYLYRIYAKLGISTRGELRSFFPAAVDAGK